MPVAPSAPTFEHHRHALGIGEARPRISWKTTAPPDWVPAGYELEVTRGGVPVVTGPVASRESVLVPWPGEPLLSREAAHVRVRVWGEGESTPSPWSAAAEVEAGLLVPSDWLALAVGPAWPEGDAHDGRRAPLVRGGFSLAGPVAHARLYVTAHGLYEVEINGRRVGDDILSPGWTEYGHRLRYYTYDVTDHLRPGPNAVGAWLGDGWYRGRIGFDGGRRDTYGHELALVAQLHVTLEDGTEQVLTTDHAWRAAPGPILFSGLYEGERYDAREELTGWSDPGFDDTGWSGVTARPVDASVLVAPQGPPVRCTEELSPVEVLTTPSGRTVLDFGQNFAGRVRLRVHGPAGTTITVRHAEVLEDGELCTRPLREAESRDTYTLVGGEPEEWEPRFTIHGFRYAEVDGWPGELRPGDVVGRVLHTDLERTGWFSCSDPLVERLHENVVWSMRSNFVDIPTDCPQRDERLGWTGDIQVFAPTAAFLYDVSGMLSSWLRDVAVAQLPDGTVPWYVPVIHGNDVWTPIRPGAGWGDAAVLTPWTLFERTGDRGVLAAQYDSAKAWVDLVERLAGPERLWDSGFQLGDWLDPSAPPDDPADARTDRYLVATAYFARSARHLAATAAELGLDGDAERYLRLADEVRAAFLGAYVLPDGRMTSDAQTAYALAICFGLLPEDLVGAAGDRLAALVRAEGGRIATGFAGTPVICDALTRTGHLDEAYSLLLQRECPSWLYTVLSGGTTIWERWDSRLPDGSVNPGGMTSFNHYALGSVADWLHRVVAGMAPAAPGYRSIEFRPRPGGGLTSASARHETPYGTASISWRIVDGRLDVTVQVPTGSTARVVLPGERTELVGPGVHHFTETVRLAA